jgi:nitroreductase
MSEMGIFEVMYSSRALRRLKPDPLPDEIIAKLLDATIRAPSAGNGQNWLFMVVKDPEQRRRLGEIYRKAGAMVAEFYLRMGRPDHMSEEQFEKFARSGLYLHEHIGEAPLLILPCLRLDSPPAFSDLPATTQTAMMSSFQWMAGASIYPAVQNLILACRALGLGTCLTTNHMLFEDEVREVLGLPPEYRTFALLPVGYPRGKFGPVKRRPLDQVVNLDRFGNRAPWTIS